MRMFLAITAVFVAVTQASAYEAPCDYRELARKHELAHAAFADMMGKPDSPEYLAAAHRVGHTFSNVEACRALINALAAPSEEKEAMFDQAAVQ